MNINIKETVAVTLRLNKEEAIWLRNRMLNYFPEYPNDKGSESEESKKRRLHLWEALKDIN